MKSSHTHTTLNYIKSQNRITYTLELLSSDVCKKKRKKKNRMNEILCPFVCDGLLLQSPFCGIIQYVHVIDLTQIPFGIHTWATQSRIDRKRCCVNEWVRERSTSD